MRDHLPVGGGDAAIIALAALLVAVLVGGVALWLSSGGAM